MDLRRILLFNSFSQTHESILTFYEKENATKKSQNIFVEKKTIKNETAHLCVLTFSPFSFFFYYVI
jgi:phage terminase large subunit-like protein